MSAQVSFTVLLDNYIEASAQIAIHDQLQTAQDELKAGGGGGGGGGQQVPVVAFKTNTTNTQRCTPLGSAHTGATGRIRRSSLPLALRLFFSI